MQKHFILTIIFIAFLGILVISASSSPPVENDPYTGLYFVHGSKIMKYYTCPFIETCGPDDGPFIDTTYISSVLAVKFIDDKTDTLHFFGLPGADERENKIYFGRDQLSDGVGNISLYDVLVHYRIYGALYNNSFEIRLNNAGNHYQAIGNLSNNKINILGKNTFKTITVEYDLVGEKIDIKN